MKRMVMRGNNRHFARATAFHEMFPGHRLQLFMADRHASHRKALFETPFFVEGWALYWEMLLYDRGDFHTTPEGRVGALWWRMHRCMRILFSLKFHLGEMTAHEAVDMLVGDIYGQDYSKLGLKSTMIASSFGKVFKKEGGQKRTFRAEDISKSLLYAISNNIGQIA